MSETRSRDRRTLQLTDPAATSTRSSNVRVRRVGPLVIAGILGLWLLSIRDNRTASAVALDQPNLNRIAVLEFEDLSEDQSLGDLARGLQRSLIHQLATVSAIRVVALAGVRDLDPSAAGASGLGQQLGVGNLVTGQVQASDGQVRVFVQLTDPADGESVRTHQIDVPETDLFQLQDEVAQFATRFLRERLGDEIRVRGYQTGTRNSEAWVLVQQAYDIGEPFWKAHGMVPGHDDPATTVRLDRAAELAERAIALDPTWAEARYVRAMVENARWRFSGGLREIGPAAIEVLEFALSVLEFDPDHFRTHALVGDLQISRAISTPRSEPARDSLFWEAEESLFRAVDGQPSLASAWGSLSSAASFQGKTQDALNYAVRALEEDPFLSSGPTLYRKIGLSAMSVEDYQMSADWIRRGQEMYPEEPRFIEAMLTLEHFSGALLLSPDSIRSLLAEANRIDPPTVEGKDYEFLYFYRRIAAAGALARAGEPGSAREMLAEVRREVAGREIWYPEVVGSEIPVYLTLGDTATAVARAVEWLEIGDFGVDILESLPLVRAVVPLLPDSVVQKHR